MGAPPVSRRVRPRFCHSVSTSKSMHRNHLALIAKPRPEGLGKRAGDSGKH